MLKKSEGELNSGNLRIGIIVSKFNEHIIENLLDGALEAFENNGVEEDNIEVFFVPGAFEIPTVLKKLCRENSELKRFDGFITIGCVIKGETAHFEYICSSVSQNINKISCEYEMPTGFCVLTCYTALQAYERSGMPPNAENNKSFEAAVSLLEMISLMNKL